MPSLKLFVVTAGNLADKEYNFSSTLIVPGKEGEVAHLSFSRVNWGCCFVCRYNPHVLLTKINSTFSCALKIFDAKNSSCPNLVKVDEM